MITLLLILLALVVSMDAVLNRFFLFKRPWYLSPVLWLTTPWIFSATLLSLPIFVHRETIEGHHVLFIFVCHLAFAAGCWIHSLTSRKAEAYSPTPLKSNHLLVFAALGLIGQFAGTMDSISSSGLSILERLTAEGLAQTRASVFLTQAGMTDSSGWARLTPLIAFSYIYIACYVFAEKKEGGQPGSQMKIALWLSIGAIAFNSLLINAGRMHLILLGLIVLIIFLIKASQFKRQTKSARTNSRSFLVFASSTSAVIIIAVAATLFGQARSSDQQNADNYLFISHRAELSPLVSELTKNEPTLRFGLFTLSYFTVPIPTLSIYLDTPDYRYPGPYWGQYNLPPIIGRIAKRIDDDSYAPWPLLRANVFDLLAREGFATNVWSTLLRDLSVDVGIRGTPFAMLALGFITSFLISYSIRTLNPLIAITASALLVVCAFSVFHSLLYIEYIAGLIFIPALTFAAMRVYADLSRKGKS